VLDGKAIFKPTASSWTQVFSGALTAMARKNDKVVAITAAMPDGTGLVEFRREFPERYIDVGINESHGVAMAGGLAKAGLLPVVAIYATFMQRATDQVFQELALQKLPAILCMDRAGLVGSDGAVHHGFMDIAMLRPIPGITLMAPADAAEMTAAMDLAASLEGPSAIRYPRDEVPPALPGDCPPFELGKARTVREGADATLLCYGVTVEPAMEAADLLAEQNLRVGVVNARFAKPLDVVTISRVIASGKPVLVIEDHAVIGGFGSAVMELAAARGLNASNVRLLGLPDRFIAHATRQEQLTEVGLDAPNIVAMVKDMIQTATAKHPAAKPARNLI
jgi:1-deoxy-D-xylulose-5-phosphate synthase